MQSPASILMAEASRTEELPRAMQLYPFLALDYDYTALQLNIVDDARDIVGRKRGEAGERKRKRSRSKRKCIDKEERRERGKSMRFLLAFTEAGCVACGLVI